MRLARAPRRRPVPDGSRCLYCGRERFARPEEGPCRTCSRADSSWPRVPPRASARAASRPSPARPPPRPSRSRSAAATAPSSCPTLDRMFDQLGGLGRLVKGRTVAIKLNLTGSPQLRLGSRPAGPRALGAPAHDRRRRAPDGPRRRAAHPAAREPVRERRPARGVHVPGGLGRERLHERGRVRRAREHQRARPRDGLPPLRRAERRAALPVLPAQPLLPRLRRVRLARQAQGPHDGRRDAQHEELLRQHPDHDLRRLRPKGHAGPRAAQRPRARVPRGRAPAPELRRRGARPDLAAPRGLPAAARDRRHLRGAADRPRDHRRHRVDGRRRGPVGRRRGLPPGSAGRRHELRQHRRRRDRGDGLRPDGEAAARRPSTPATTSSSSPSRPASARATCGGSRWRACRLRRRATTSRR